MVIRRGQVSKPLSHLWFMKESESEVAQLCPTLCDPVDGSLPGSSVHGIFKVRVPEWVTISFSKGSSQPRDRTQVSQLEAGTLTEPPGKLLPVGYLFYIWECKFPCYSFHASHPLLPSSHVHKCILYVCFSIATYKTFSF